MSKLEEKLQDLEEQQEKVERQIDRERSHKKILCSCGERHRICDLSAIQTYWYTSPHGCTGGDYWNSGELNFICPATEIRNRLLFSVRWDESRNFDKNPEHQFKRYYSHLFKEINDEHGESSDRFFNNYDVDNHRKKFSLVEKI